MINILFTPELAHFSAIFPCNLTKLEKFTPEIPLLLACG
jgi:hypothetical protein